MKPGIVRDNKRCGYCERMTYRHGSSQVKADKWCQSTRDHIVPRSYDFLPEAKRSALINACQGCNTIKGDAPSEIFSFWIRENREGDVPERHKRFRAFMLALAITGWEVAREMAVQERRRAPRAPEPPPQNIADIVRRFLS